MLLSLHLLPDEQLSYVRISMFSARNRRWWILVAMTGSLAMIMIDQTIVSVALPRIQRDLDLSQTDLQWVINAYILALAATVAIGGRIGDLVGRVKAFMGGAVLFAGSSVLCGLAPNETVIILGRVLQGIGAAFMQPASAAIVTTTFGLHERGKAMAVYAGVAMSFMAAGPLLGGALTQYLSWRWAVWINIPVAAAAMALTLLVRPKDEKPLSQSVDFAGLSLLILGAPALVLAIQQGRTWGWTSPAILVLFAAGIGLLGLLMVVETRVKNPLIEMRLFQNRSFAADTLVLFCTQFALVGQVVFGAIYMQNVLGFSPLKAGLGMLPTVIPAVIMAQVAGRIFDRTGVKIPAAIGTALIFAGFFHQALFLTKESYAWLAPGMAILGAGAGFVMSPTNTDALSRVPGVLRGQASGLVQTFRQMGGTVGMAAMGALVSTLEQGKISAIIKGTGGGPGHEAILGGLVTEARDGQVGALSKVASTYPHLVQELQDAVSLGISGGYFLAGAVMLMGFFVALFFMVPGRQREDPKTLTSLPL